MTFEVLGTDDVAAALKVSRRQVQRLIAAGDIRAVKVGERWRVRPGDLEAYLDGCPDNQPTAGRLRAVAS